MRRHMFLVMAVVLLLLLRMMDVEMVTMMAQVRMRESLLILMQVVKGQHLLLLPKEKKKKTFRDQCMKRLVDAYEMKAQSSKHSATSQVIDHVRDEITKMMEQVIEDGAEEGGDEHYYATQLLKTKENRDMFQTLKTPNGRLNWLRRAWEDRNKN
ncbi:unnamed protein product [Urochloa humidicola]